jgi:hypothetical protein
VDVAFWREIDGVAVCHLVDFDVIRPEGGYGVEGGI